MEVKIEERDAKAVYFSLDGYDDAKLLAEAAKFLEKLQQQPGGVWMLLGINRQSDDYGSHITLFLERTATILPRPPTADAAQARPLPYETPKEVKIRYL